jgi:PBP1b-binding outer membrane lipoprotein LpoB
MKKNIISLLLATLIVSCAPNKESIPDAKPAPVEKVDRKELPDTGATRKRAKKLLQIIFGGVNK